MSLRRVPLRRITFNKPEIQQPLGPLNFWSISTLPPPAPASCLLPPAPAACPRSPVVLRQRCSVVDLNRGFSWLSEPKLLEPEALSFV